MIAIIYVLGVLAAFFISRALRRAVDVLQDSWSVIIIYSVICLLSWLAFIAFGICYLIIVDWESNTKPPKWL